MLHLTATAPSSTGGVSSSSVTAASWARPEGPTAGGWGDSNAGPSLEGLPGGGCAGGLTCGSFVPAVTARARCSPLSAGSVCTHRVPAGPVPSGRGRLRCSGPPRPGTDRPAGQARPMQALSRTAGYLSVWSSISAVGRCASTDSMPLITLALL
jgi:hypothetical protein